MSVLAWADPPPVAERYPMPEFPTAEPGSVVDLRFVAEMSTGRGHSRVLIPALHTWLDDNPEVWALVGTHDREGTVTHTTSGFHPYALPKRGLIGCHIDSRSYARSAILLSAADREAVHASLARALKIDSDEADGEIRLPRLTKDPFGWTSAELNSAVAAARDWLYPTEELVAA